MSTPTSSSTRAAGPARWDVDAWADLRGGLRFLLLIASIAVLSAGVPAGLLASVPDAPRSEAWVLTLGIMVWAGGRLSFLWVAGVPRLFDYFFWVFVYIFMGMAPTAQIRSGLTSTTTPGVDPGLDVPTAGIVIIGLVCYEVGRIICILVEHRRITGKAPSPAVSVVGAGRTWALFLISLLASAYYLMRVGPTIALGSREGAQAARAAAWADPSVRAMAYAAAVYPLLVAVGALAQLRKAAATPTARFAILGAACVGAGFLLLVVNPVASARYTFGTVAFALAVYAGATRTRRRARLTMLTGIVGFLAVFPIADAFRSTEVRVSRAGFFDEYLSNPDYDAFWQIANALSFWIDGHVVPLLQGLGSVLFFVPRSIWPGKPTDTGSLLADYRGYSFENLSAPLWAEALVNGGILMVVITFLLLGLSLRALDTRISRELRVGGPWAIVGAILPVYMTILLRGSLLQATGALVITIVCAALVRARRPEGDDPPGEPGEGSIRLRASSPSPGRGSW